MKGDEKVDQLQRILGSDMFWRLTKASAFLDFVGWETIKGRGDQITQTVIAEEAFDPPLGENELRSLAQRVRGKLAEYYAYGSVGYNDPILITIPNDSYKVVFGPNPNILRIAS